MAGVAGVSKEFAVDMLSKMAVFGASELEPAKSKSLWRDRAPYSDQGRICWILGSLSHPHYMLVVIINTVPCQKFGFLLGRVHTKQKPKLLN